MRRKPVVISAATYPEPARIGRLRERYGDELPEIVAFDDLAAARERTPLLAAETDLAVLLDGADGDAVALVAAELARLRQIETDRLDALATAAWQMLGRAEDVTRPLVRLGDNAYIAWVGTADAPTGHVMTEQDALDVGFPPERIAAAEDATGPNGIGNRAGPGEVALTTAAIVEAYASEQAYREFRLTPEKMQPYTTCDMALNAATGNWETGDPYWVPWAPDAVPADLPAKFSDRF